MDPNIIGGILLLVVWGITAVADRLADRTNLGRRTKREAAAGRLAAAGQFRGAAQALGLKPAPDDELEDLCFKGRIDGTMVALAGAVRPPVSLTTTITVELDAALVGEIGLESRSRPAASDLARADLPGQVDIETGDPSFDRAIEVSGRESVARALLTATVRRRLAALARKDALSLASGRLSFRLSLQVLDRSRLKDALVALVHEVVDAAQCLPRISDVGAALAENARHDPEPTVRACCFRTLLAEFSTCPEMRDTLDAGVADPSDAVRVIAATALGERGVAVLREIALRPNSEENPAAHAIKVLGRRLSSPEIAAILDAALAAGRAGVALAAIETLGRSGDETARQRLAAALRDADESVAVAAAGALGAAQVPGAERTLVGALYSPVTAVRHAVVAALAQAGGMDSLAVLRSLLDESVADPAVSALVRHTISVIQARIPGASPGHVSLAEGEAGQLSMAGEDRRGQVSLPGEAHLAAGGRSNVAARKRVSEPRG